MLAYSKVQGHVADSSVVPPEVWAYLAERGISRFLATTLELKFLEAHKLMAAARGAPSNYSEDTRWAIVFPHYDLRGDLLDWWSARLVSVGLAAQRQDAPKLRLVHSFADVATLPSFGKMFCPPNEAPAVYLPRGSGLPNWDQLPDGQRVFIHESVLKAVNGAALGSYGVGLNGVWGWRSQKHGIALAAQLRELPWKAKKLQPVILFDTNIDTNWQVQEAAKRLAVKILEITGQRAKLLRMPDPKVWAGALPSEGHKDYGFDDYVRLAGRDAACALLARPDDELEELELHPVELMKLELNSKVVVVQSLGRIADLETGTLMSRQVFTDVNYATYTAEVEAANPEHPPKIVNVPKLWLADPRRNSVDDLVYEPGQQKLICGPLPGSTGQSHLNTWNGWGVEPHYGDVTPWLTLLANNVEDEELSTWILDWLAYPIQHPGEKMNSLLLLFGPSGTGKDLFLAPIHRIYGSQNSIKISTDELKSSFTSLYAQRQLVHADELKRVTDAADYVNQKIKGLVTNETLTVNRKGDPEYKVRNNGNLVITSNYYDCLKLDEDDRRSAVIRWSPVLPELDHRGNEPYWSAYVEWAFGEAGASALFYFLLNRDLTKFNPKAWAPHTRWKEDVIDAARSSIERFVAQLKSDPDLHLPPLAAARQLFTAKELASYHYGEEAKKGQVDALSNELRNQNFVRANGGKSLKTKFGVNRWWVIPRGLTPKGQAPEDWSKSDVCTKHLKLYGL